MKKGLLTIGVLFSLLITSCSQPAKKQPVNANAQAKLKQKGGSCCVNKVPSRFAIVKNDSLSLKKGN